jgi:hypothetical protein
MQMPSGHGKLNPVFIYASFQNATEVIIIEYLKSLDVQGDRE